MWFADEILTGQQSESAPATPVRGLTFSPLMRRDLGEPARSPASSPQIRRTLKPHRTTINVGLKNEKYTQIHTSLKESNVANTNINVFHWDLVSYTDLNEYIVVK